MDLFSEPRSITHRYGRCIDDLRRLFVFHGLHCGAPEDFAALAAKLTASKAFLTDLSALCRSLRDAEQGDLSSEEMLTAIALASAGEDLVEGRAGSVAATRTVETLRIFLAGIGGWRDTEENPRPFDPVRSIVATPQAADTGDRPRGVIAAMADPHSTRGDLELAITEIKVYLDDIDRRIGRLEPRLEDITQIVQSSSELHQRPLERSVARALPEQEGTFHVSPAPLPDGNSPASTARRHGAMGLIARSIEALTRAGDDQAPASPEARDEAGPPPTPPLPTHPRPFVVDAAIPAAEAPVPPPVWPQAGTDASNLVSLPSTPPTGAFPPAALPTPPWQRWMSQDPDRSEEPLSSEAHPSPIHLAPAPTELPGWVRKGVKLVAANQVERSWKETAGRYLGIVAVLLATLGTIGLAVSFRSPEAAAERAASGGQPGPSASPAQPASTASLTPPQKTSNTPPVALTETRPSPPSGLREPFAAVPATGRVAGARSEIPKRTPRIEEPHATTLSARHDPPSPHPGAPVAAAATGSAGRVRSSSSSADTPPASTAFPSPGPIDPRGSTDGRRIVVPESSMRRNLISARTPVYPPEAMRQNLEGTVVLNAFLAKDGTVKRMDVLRGPGIFVKSALSAVSWRRYKPYLVQGKPVEVETTITVNYPPH